MIFWRLAYFLIAKEGYGIIHLFENQKELWLEKLENKKAPIVRLVQENLTWSTILQRDIEYTAGNGDRVRKRIGRSELSIANIYISPHPPVDEYEFRFADPYTYPEGHKTTVNSIILAEGEYENGFQQISGLFNKPVTIEWGDEPTVAEIEATKHAALQHAVKAVKEEKAFFANGKPFFTYLFIIVQVALFLLLELKGGSTNNYTLIKYGAKVNQLILDGEWWRFITPVFLHIGFIHLLMNTIALYYLGVTVERMYGNVRFLFIYLFAGFTGVLASFIFSPNFSAGASGAIFGCFGALLYFGAINPKLFFRTMGMNLFFILALNLAFGFSWNGIDNAGHLGGLAGGFLAAGIVHFPRKKILWLQGLFLTVSIASVGGSLYYGFHSYELGGNENSTLVKAQQLMDQKDYDGAYTVLKEYQKNAKNPSAEFYLHLSFVELKKEMFLDSKSHLKMAINLDSKMPQAYYYLAIIYFNENNLEEAKVYVEKAAKLDPSEKAYKNFIQTINHYLDQNGG